MLDIRRDERVEGFENEIERVFTRVDASDIRYDNARRSEGATREPAIGCRCKRCRMQVSEKRTAKR